MTDKRNIDIQQVQEQDTVCEAATYVVKQVCRQGWTEQHILKGVLKKLCF